MSDPKRPFVLLVVDDAPEIHTLIDARLRQEGHEILHALDARSAMDLAIQHRPDLLLLDLDLDGESGLDLCRDLRARPGFAALPIIFLTGNADVDVKVEALDAGAVDYVVKPFNADELRARVRAALRTARQAPMWERATIVSDAGPEGDLLGGRYALRDRLGSGGSGDVYRAHDTRDDRMVAVKRLRPELADIPDVISRLRREAQAAALARHPNVVQVLEVSDDDQGAPFIVQELLEGETLAARMTREPQLTLAETLSLMVPIAEAVGAAHEQGVIHRDLKPENVFLAKGDPGGEVTPKVLDFGISKIGPQTEELRLTHTGAVMGTPAYMSPEQITGERSIQASSDVWQLGVMLYELVSGRRPFTGDTPWKLFQATLHEEPKPLCDAAPHAPEALERIIQRCLRRTPEERYRDARELVRDLRDLAGAPS